MCVCVCKVNMVAEHSKFHQHEKKLEESTDQYIPALKEWIVTCNFGSMADETI